MLWLRLVAAGSRIAGEFSSASNITSTCPIPAPAMHNASHVTEALRVARQARHCIM